ncbi:hypothetical protein BDR26DRAFT_870185 [Obelidium mucronatum]|nr:hypothetical protein BDR26DRAFT_870185 [Obelidium mucronatum]
MRPPQRPRWSPSPSASGQRYSLDGALDQTATETAAAATPTMIMSSDQMFLSLHRLSLADVNKDLPATPLLSPLEGAGFDHPLVCTGRMPVSQPTTPLLLQPPLPPTLAVSSTVPGLPLPLPLPPSRSLPLSPSPPLLKRKRVSFVSDSLPAIVPLDFTTFGTISTRNRFPQKSCIKQSVIPPPTAEGNSQQQEVPIFVRRALERQRQELEKRAAAAAAAAAAGSSSSSLLPPQSAAVPKFQVAVVKNHHPPQFVTRKDSIVFTRLFDSFKKTKSATGTTATAGMKRSFDWLNDDDRDDDTDDGNHDTTTAMTTRTTPRTNDAPNYYSIDDDIIVSSSSSSSSVKKSPRSKKRFSFTLGWTTPATVPKAFSLESLSSSSSSSSPPPSSSSSILSSSPSSSPSRVRQKHQTSIPQWLIRTSSSSSSSSSSYSPSSSSTTTSNPESSKPNKRVKIMKWFEK